MTSIFDPTGKQTACTIIEAGPCVVTQVKTTATDGYSAIQLSFGDKNDKHSNKAEKNHFAKASTAPKKFSKEFRNFSIEKNIITPDYYKIEGFHPELSEYKFVSIVWVKNNIYRFDLVYPKNDSTKWAKRMETIEEEGMQCN